MKEYLIVLGLSPWEVSFLANLGAVVLEMIVLEVVEIEVEGVGTFLRTWVARFWGWDTGVFDLSFQTHSN